MFAFLAALISWLAYIKKDESAEQLNNIQQTLQKPRIIYIDKQSLFLKRTDSSNLKTKN
jgi:hypothetical protein